MNNPISHIHHSHYHTCPPAEKASVAEVRLMEVCMQRLQRATGQTVSAQAVFQTLERERGKREHHQCSAHIS